MHPCTGSGVTSLAHALLISSGGAAGDDRGVSE